MSKDTPHLLSPKEMYRYTYSFCAQKGLIQKLKQDQDIPESERFKKRNIDKDGLSLLDAVRCVQDEKRTLFFLNELDRYLTKNHIVLEAGIGTGILAFFAASRASKVYGVEINTTILQFAEKVQVYLTQKKVLSSRPILSLGDATRSRIPEKVDVLVSENIYTGMFFEKQVQIVNHLLSFLKRGGVVIPAALKSFVLLSETHFPHVPHNAELFVPEPEKESLFKTRALSTPRMYDTILFKKKMRRKVHKSLVLKATRNGEVNSIIIYSEVLMPSGASLKRGATTFLNNDIVLAVAPSLKVKRGDNVRLRLSYEYGAKPETAMLHVSLLK